MNPKPRPYPARTSVLTDMLDARLDEVAARARAARDAGGDRWAVIRTMNAIAVADMSAYDSAIKMEGVSAAVAVAELRLAEAEATVPASARGTA
jgi:hypothetical protein